MEADIKEAVIVRGKRIALAHTIVYRVEPCTNPACVLEDEGAKGFGSDIEEFQDVGDIVELEGVID